MSIATPALAGRGVAVTRPEPAGGPLERRLAARGACVARWTAIEFAPPADPRPFAAALARLERYDWLLVTSPHAAAVLTGAVSAPPASLRIAAVGGATAAELEGAGWRVERTGAGGGSAGLVESFRAAADGAGRRAFHATSSAAGTALEEGLAALGLAVERVEAYRTESMPLDAAAVAADVASGRVEAVTFASPSALDGLVAALGRDAAVALLSGVAVASIGPTTSRALAACGRPPDAEAAPSTLDGLVEAVERALAVHPSSRRPSAAVLVPSGGPSR